jgi:hypothetical protein
MPPSPDTLDTLTSIGTQGALVATLIWFARRFVAQHDALLARIDLVLAELAASRTAMDRAREALAPHHHE